MNRRAHDPPPLSVRARRLGGALGRRAVLAGPLIAVVGVILLFAYGLTRASQGRTLVSEISAGTKPAAPGFKLEAFWPPTGPPTRTVARATESGALDLDRLRGHPIVLNFWASWCIACRAEARLLTAAAASHPGVVFIGVDVQDLRGDAVSFLRRYHVAYTAVWDKTNSTYEDYGLTGVPETYYIDRRGRIVDHNPGAVSITSLAAGISAAAR